jgi:hypothetical protein
LRVDNDDDDDDEEDVAGQVVGGSIYIFLGRFEIYFPREFLLPHPLPKNTKTDDPKPMVPAQRGRLLGYIYRTGALSLSPSPAFPVWFVDPERKERQNAALCVYFFLLSLASGESSHQIAGGPTVFWFFLLPILHVFIMWTPTAHNNETWSSISALLS